MRSVIAIALLLGTVVGIAAFALGWFKLSPSSKGQRTDIIALDDRTTRDRDEFQTKTDTQFKAMDLSLEELKTRAKNGHTVTNEKMNEAIDDLTKKTEAAREDFRELKTATQERWDVLKTRLSASLEKLKDGFERAFARFMNESAHADDLLARVITS